MPATESGDADREDEAGDADWAIPADRMNGRELDQWVAMIDEPADDPEHPYQYPVGLP